MVSGPRPAVTGCHGDLAALDALAEGYLSGWVLRRERRDKSGVLAVGVLLLACAVGLVGAAVWKGTAEPPPSLPDVPGGTLT